MSKPTPARDWASPDPSKNIKLAEAKALGQSLGSLGLFLVDLCVVTTTGNVISEEELRGNNWQAPNAVNLMGALSGPNRVQFNVAQFKADLADCATAESPVTALCELIHSVLPTTDALTYIARMPSVQAAVAGALKVF